MSETVIVLKHKDMAESFLQDALQAGYEPEPFPGLPRFYRVPGVSADRFPLANHPSVDFVEEGDKELKPAAELYETTVNSDGSGGWAPARAIRREPPWGSPVSSRFPFQTTFKCERSGKGVDIYMIDSGVALDHPEFGGRAVMPWRAQDSYSRADDSNHGTGCASMAIGENTGIARDAGFRCFKHFDSNSGSTSSNAIAAMGAIIEDYNRRANSNRPAVMFFSWSGFSSGINVAVSEMIDAGLVCCFPAGNDIEDLGTITQYPAESDPDCIICGGSNIADHLYWVKYYSESASEWRTHGTNWGEEVSICAPAQAVWLAANPTGYRVSNGTSYATPLVAGVIACMLEGYNRLTTRAEVQAVKQKLLDNATTGALQGLAVHGLPTEGFDPADADAGSGEAILSVPDRLLYLNPFEPFEVIPGLTPKT